MNRPESRLNFDEVLPDREDGSSSLVHRLLVATGKLGRIPPVALAPLWIALIIVASWPWATLRMAAGIALAVLLAVDWAMLANLPRMSRSWGPVTPSLLGLALVHSLLFWLPGILAPNRLSLSLTVGANAVLAGTAIYATWIEPFRVRLTQETYSVAGWTGGLPVHVLHLSDIHFEGWSLREQRLLAWLTELKPDMVLLTGDYLNLSSVQDPRAQQGVRELLSRFEAPLGVYAVTGSPTVDVNTVIPGIFKGLPIRFLEDEAITVDAAGRKVCLLGVRNTYDEERDGHALRSLAAATSQNGLRILLYHTPDLMPVAASLGIDLYLCGHTHGGQIRLPLYGAMATSSRWGKRYEQGRFLERATTLYVSRGLGLEGLGAPRARFLAPPEAILWELRPADS